MTKEERELLVATAEGVHALLQLQVFAFTGNGSIKDTQDRMRTIGFAQGAIEYCLRKFPK